MDFRMTLTGTEPLLMHNARLADPLDSATKALKVVSGKRKKTEDDHAEMARLEYLGGLYLDPDVGPYIPGENIERCLVDAGKITRSGRMITQGVFVKTNVNPVGYKGPRDPEGLWADTNFRLVKSVKVTTSRIMRTRPMFRQWRLDAEGVLDTAILSLEDLRSIAETAGARIGLGDYRPRYGRFTVEVEEL